MSRVTTELSEHGDTQVVTCRYVSDGSAGTHAEIYTRPNTINDPTPTWLMIVTDDYEGCAMLHIEALPLVIEALQKIQKQLSTGGELPK
jgi:hypothetical protein